MGWLPCLDDPLEWRSTRAEAAPRDIHLVEGLDVEDVESIAAVHQDSGEAHIAHNWVDHKQIASRIRDVVGVMRT